MILRELFYHDPETVEFVDDKRYEAEYDESPIKKSDTRKTRLTLSQLNRIRKASELHTEEKRKEAARTALAKLEEAEKVAQQKLVDAEAMLLQEYDLGESVMLP